MVWHLKPFSSRHCFSHAWQNHRRRPNPLLLILLPMAFVLPASARPILYVGKEVERSVQRKRRELKASKGQEIGKMGMLRSVQESRERSLEVAQINAISRLLYNTSHDTTQRGLVLLELPKLVSWFFNLMFIVGWMFMWMNEYEMKLNT